MATTASNREPTMLDDRAEAEVLDPGELRQRVASTVRDLRARSGRSLADLATAAGIAKSTLHAIESGEANPGIETLWSLARALDVSFGELLEPATPAVRVVRAGEAPQVVSESGAMQAHLLAATSHRARVEVYSLALQPGLAHDGQPHTDGTIEHVLVIAGELQVGPEGAEVTLAPGDLASFAGDRVHGYRALAEGTEAVLVIEYP